MHKDAEFRGTDNLWIAIVTQDDDSGYTFTTPENVTSTGQIQRTTNSSSETHYYSNIGSIVIITDGGDTVTINTPVLDLKTIATMTGQAYDETTGVLITGEPVPVDLALIYREQLTDGTWRYVAKYKATLTQPPEEISVTTSNDINTNGQQLVFACNKTIHAFNTGGHADGIILDERDGKCDFSTFFSTVYTPDTIGTLAKAAVTALTLDAASASLVIGGTATLTATVAPTGSPVRWVSSNANVASVSGGVVTAHAVGVAVITASAGNYAAQCTVTVSTE